MRLNKGSTAAIYHQHNLHVVVTVEQNRQIDDACRILNCLLIGRAAQQKIAHPLDSNPF